MEFSRQEYWSELLFPSPGSLPDQGLNSHLLHGQEHSLPLCHLGCKFFLSQWSQGLERLWQSPFPFQTFQTTALHVREKGKEKLKKYTCMLSCFYLVLLFVTPWTAAHQAPLSMGFFRQEHWSGVPLPSPLHVLTYAILTTTQARVVPLTPFYKWRNLGIEI